jgi:hypothetical protein
MFNLGTRANAILAGLCMLSWVTFLVVVVISMAKGASASHASESKVFLSVCVAIAFSLAALLLLVAIQDCWKGETSYTAKGKLLSSDGIQREFEVETKTAFRTSSPWTFWSIVLAKAFAGLLGLAAGGGFLMQFGPH